MWNLSFFLNFIATLYEGNITECQLIELWYSYSRAVYLFSSLLSCFRLACAVWYFHWRLKCCVLMRLLINENKKRLWKCVCRSVVLKKVSKMAVEMYLMYNKWGSSEERYVAVSLVSTDGVRAWRCRYDCGRHIGSCSWEYSVVTVKVCLW